MTQIDERILLWVNGFVGKSAVLDRIMTWLASDYFIPVTLSLMLLGLWFFTRDTSNPENLQRGIVVAAISVGVTCGFVLLANNIYRHQHPFVDMPQLLDTVKHIFYPIHDPPFPSNTSAVTFAAATSIWQRSRKLGAVFFIPAILMPLAKVYAAVYYPTDILAGAVLGILTSYFAYKVMMPVFNPIIKRVFLALRKLCLA